MRFSGAALHSPIPNSGPQAKTDAPRRKLAFVFVFGWELPSKFYKFLAVMATGYVGVCASWARNRTQSSVGCEVLGGQDEIPGDPEVLLKDRMKKGKERLDRWFSH